MSVYKASDEETLFAHHCLKDWKGEALITDEQYHLLEQDTRSTYRRTNLFLRVVLFLFTLLIVTASIGLLFVLFLNGASAQHDGFFLLPAAALCYAAAELAVSRHKLYRYGIEEALCASSVVYLCVGLFEVLPHSSSHSAELIVSVSAAALCLWIWHRFGFAYAPIAAMLFAPWFAAAATSSSIAQRILIASLYTAGVFLVAILRRPHRFTYLEERYSIAEAALWLGVYLVLNLQILPSDLLGIFDFARTVTRDATGPFYWTTWVLTWCLPPLILFRGIRARDRFVLGAGAITCLLTFVTNKSYLHWERHTWDPMLLGTVLIATVVLLRRWLQQAPDGIRNGFTARRLSGRDKAWMSAAATAAGFAASTSPAPHSEPQPHFDGGRSGGAGASSDF